MPLGWMMASLAAVVPVGAAVWSNRRSALLHAMIWAAFAWGAWSGALYFDCAVSRYVALSLTACAGVAVLGARRPGVGMWNGVVGGLLVTLLIPLAQRFLTDSSWLDQPVWRGFVAVALTVGILNFLPTRLGPAALALLIGCLIVLLKLETLSHEWKWLAYGLIVASPWLGWLGLVSQRNRSDWSRFRDRFGFVWARRVQEMFQAASMHAGRDVALTWAGVRPIDGAELSPSDAEASRELLAALLRRFTD